MKHKKPLKTSTRKWDHYECGRCNINSDTKGRYCPCPRGSCEAKIVGKVVETTTVEYKPLVKKK